MAILASPPPRLFAIWSMADCEIPVVPKRKSSSQSFGTFRNFQLDKGAVSCRGEGVSHGSKGSPVRTALHSIMWLKSRRVRRRLIGISGADVAVLYLLVEKDN